MTLVDAGPLVALFDPRDADHDRVRRRIRNEKALVTTTPVLTETFHLLTPASRGARALRALVASMGLDVWHLDTKALLRAFDLMEAYRDSPMDLADASLVVAAERLGTRRVLTLDARHFHAYRALRGDRRVPFEILRC